MTSIISHQILQALLMLATSDICPEANWYDGIDMSRTVRINKCEIPLTDDMHARDALAFYRAARKLAGRQ